MRDSNGWRHRAARRTAPDRGRNRDRSRLSRRLSIESLETRNLLSTITVTSLEDNLDVDGQVTFREAILAANRDIRVDNSNAGSGRDTIRFAPSIAGPGPYTIRPLSPLPVITEPIVIDGTLTVGYNGQPLIELDGSQAGLAAGLFIRAGNSTVRGLAINRFAASGVLLVGGGENLLESNYIGTDVTGTRAMPNRGNGINVVNSSGNTIGGTTRNERNLISGNGHAGILISGEASSGNLVVGNGIGVNRLGNGAIGNHRQGVVISQASNNTVGGLVAGSGNTISGNGNTGIRLVGAASSQNVIQGNIIGPDDSGSVSLGTQRRGLDVRSPRNLIGGSEPGGGNIISGNTQYGLLLAGVNSDGNRVQGNHIGTDAAAVTAIANGLHGVLVSNASHNIIGGFSATAGNVISGNNRQGVLIAGSRATDNTVVGNWIGTNPDMARELGNGHNGVLIVASGNTIGSLEADSGNVIAYNQRGVWVQRGTDNRIQSNTMLANAGLGIDLARSGVTANDPKDSDRGANLQQNSPRLASNPTVQTDGQLRIDYAVSSRLGDASYPLEIEFFLADKDGFEGQRWLGSDVYNARDAVVGRKSVKLTRDAVVVAGSHIVATATDADGNTSEFSIGVPIEFARPAVSGIVFADANGDGKLDAGEPGQQNRLVRVDQPEIITKVAGGAPYVNPADLAVRSDGKYVVADLVPARVLLVDPATGQRSVLSDRGMLQRAYGLALDANDDILLIDPVAQALFKIDSKDGRQEVLSSGGALSHPTGIVVEADGQILVSNSNTAKVIRIDPLTGDQEIISAGDQLVSPQDIAVDADGQIFVVDAGPNKVIRIDPVDGTQTVIAGNSQLITPVGIAVNARGELFVSDRGQVAIFRVDPVTGIAEIAARSDQFVDPRSLTFDAEGELLVTDRYAASSEGSIFKIAPRTLVATTKTSPSGEFVFADLASREYEIRVEGSTGWLPTTVNPVSVVAANGLITPRLEMGSFKAATLRGTKYDDRDRDGVRDPGEAGLAGWTVFLDRDGNGALSVGEPSSVTDANGDYVLTGIGPGDYPIVARQQAGWTRTGSGVRVRVDRSGEFLELDLGSAFGQSMADAGMIRLRDNQTTTVVLNGSFQNAVVLIAPSLDDGDYRNLVRVVEVQSDRFVVRRHSPLGADRGPEEVAVRYVVLDAGLWRLADGALIEVGTTSLPITGNDQIASEWKTLEFASPFLKTPTLNTQVQSHYGLDFVTPRTDVVTPDSARVSLESGSETANSPASEVVGWVALDSSIGGENDLIDRVQAGLQAAPQTPNVIVISIDDLNDWVGALGGYGGTVHTPNLDRLLGNGVNFRQAIAPSVECSPSRTSVLTGLNPTTTQILRNGTHWLDTVPDAVTMPAYFRQYGYTTVAISKIFHQQPNEGDPTAWDVTYPSGPPFQPDDWSTISHVSGIRFGGVDAPLEEFQDYRTASNAMNFLQSGPESPFFLGMGIIDPHLQWIVPQEYFDLYPLEDIVLPEVPADDLNDLPEFALTHVNTTFHANSVLAQDAWAELVQAYLAEISFADAMIGRVLDSLAESPYARNTIVAVWSDHGYHLGEKMHWNKGTLWDESIRVPLGIAGPTLAEGSVVDEVVGLVDLYPTLVELAGLPPNPNLDGISLVSTIEGTGPTDRAIVVSYKFGQAVRSNQWAYLHYHDGSEELYDMQTDPGQFTNLASESRYESVLVEMRRALAPLL